MESNPGSPKYHAGSIYFCYCERKFLAINLNAPNFCFFLYILEFEFDNFRLDCSYSFYSYICKLFGISLLKIKGRLG